MQYTLVTVFVWAVLFTDVVSQLCPDLTSHIVFPEYYFQFVHSHGKYVKRKCPQGTIFHQATCRCDYPQMTGRSVKVPETTRLNTFTNTVSQPWGQRTPSSMTRRFGNYQNNMQSNNMAMKTAFANFLGGLQNRGRFNLNVARLPGPATSNIQASSTLSLQLSGSAPKTQTGASSRVDTSGNASTAVNTTPDTSAPLHDFSAPSSHPLPIDTPPSNAKTTLLNFNDMNPLPSKSYQVPTIKSVETVIQIESGVNESRTTSPKPVESSTTIAPANSVLTSSNSFGKPSGNPSNLNFMNTNPFRLNKISTNTNTNNGWNSPLWGANLNKYANQRQPFSTFQSQPSPQSGLQALFNTPKSNVIAPSSWPNNNFNQFNARSQVNQANPSDFFNKMAQINTQLKSFNSFLQGKSSPIYPVPPAHPQQNNPFPSNQMQFKSMLQQQFNNMPTTPFPQPFVPNFSTNPFQMNNQMNGGFSQTSLNNMPLNNPMPGMDFGIQNQLNKVATSFAGLPGTNWMPNPQLHWSQNIRMADMMEVTDAQRDAYVRQELLTNTNLSPAERLSLSEIMH